MSLCRASLRRSAAAIFAALLLSGAVGCEPPPQDEKSGPNPAASVSPQPMRHIDSRNPSITLPVAALARGQGDDFIAVEVREVVNPARVPLTFEVSFAPAQGEAVRLGEFSLFPADNPGRFIVATQGRVRGDGVIIVSLPSGDRAAAEGVRVGIASVSLSDR